MLNFFPIMLTDLLSARVSAAGRLFLMRNRTEVLANRAIPCYGRAPGSSQLALQKL